jgi:hypothetical protein
LTGLERKGIVRPTPIQVQGIPTVWVLIVLGSHLVINNVLYHRSSQFSHTSNIPGRNRHAALYEEYYLLRCDAL